MSVEVYDACDVYDVGDRWFLDHCVSVCESERRREVHVKERNVIS